MLPAYLQSGDCSSMQIPVAAVLRPSTQCLEKLSVPRARMLTLLVLTTGLPWCKSGSPPNSCSFITFKRFLAKSHGIGARNPSSMGHAYLPHPTPSYPRRSRGIQPSLDGLSQGTGPSMAASPRLRLPSLPIWLDALPTLYWVYDCQTVTKARPPQSQDP